MFSYRHAFHAGNHADVLKHATLIAILDYFNRKDAAYWLIDTHAGAGLYALDGSWAAHSGESESGLGRVLATDHAPELAARYLEVIRAFNPEGNIKVYPGSPCLALHAMRAHDRLRLFELHPTESGVLERNIRHQGRGALRQTIIWRADGFEGLPGLLPPPSRRGIILIDPSYEDKQDYRRTLAALRDGLKRFAGGCFMIWYPLVQRLQAHEMVRALERTRADWLNASITVRKPPADGLGLHGSGVFVVNPPWTLRASLEAALPWLTRVLGQDDHARWSLTHGGPSGAAPHPDTRGPGRGTSKRQRT